jgi:DNA-binding transcriptional regulator YdaS (Cro superfamily)
MKREQSALKRAIELAGGQTALGKLLHVKQTTVSSWLNGLTKGGVPAQHVPQITKATGVPEHELRPDVWPAPQPNRKGSDKPTEGGHFSRHKSIRRNHFVTAADVEAHIEALRAEWDD